MRSKKPSVTAVTLGQALERRLLGAPLQEEEPDRFGYGWINPAELGQLGRCQMDRCLLCPIGALERRPAGARPGASARCFHDWLL